MAQVIKINNLHSIPGADRLMVTLLAPLNLPVVVSMAEFNLAMYAIFLPVGTKLPDHLRGLPLATENGVVEPKVFFGQESRGVIIPYLCLPQEFRRTYTPEQLRLSGRNVGDVLGCTSVNGSAHFGGFGGRIGGAALGSAVYGGVSLMAEMDNTTGEVVGLFSDGQVLLAKLGRSNLVGPMAPQGVIVNPPAVEATPNAADELMARLDEFAGHEDELDDITAAAVKVWRKDRDALRLITPPADNDVTEAIIAGYRMAANASRNAIAGGLIAAIGEEQAEKLIPFIDAHTTVELTGEFQQRLETLKGTLVADQSRQQADGDVQYRLTDKGRALMTQLQAAPNQYCTNPRFSADGCC